MNTPLALGQLMISIEGIALDDQSRHRLMHPDIGGVILFSRNYENRQQLIELVQEIHDLRQPSLLVAVDQEGGVVQRFKSEFTVLPNMAMVGEAFEHTIPMPFLKSDLRATLFARLLLWFFLNGMLSKLLGIVVFCF